MGVLQTLKCKYKLIDIVRMCCVRVRGRVGRPRSLHASSPHSNLASNYFAAADSLCFLSLTIILINSYNTKLSHVQLSYDIRDLTYYLLPPKFDLVSNVSVGSVLNIIRIIVLSFHGFLITY